MKQLINMFTSPPALITVKLFDLCFAKEMIKHELDITLLN